jgi:hypothetical protein
MGVTDHRASGEWRGVRADGRGADQQGNGLRTLLIDITDALEAGAVVGSEMD